MEGTIIISACILIVWVQGIHHANIQLHNEERYVVRFVCFSLYFLLEWLQQTRISLSLFDVQGLGYLKESVCKVTSNAKL